MSTEGGIVGLNATALATTFTAIRSAIHENNLGTNVLVPLDDDAATRDGGIAALPPHLYYTMATPPPENSDEFISSRRRRRIQEEEEEENWKGIPECVGRGD